MEILKYSAICILILGAIVILAFAISTKKTIKMLFLNSFLGFGVFIALYFTRKYSGVEVYLNEYTALGSAVFGIPAVIGFLVLNLIF